MKVVILAGGLGTRLSEETDVKPKPMVEIGGRPILWHIMKNYYRHGFNEFVIALGYRGDAIKRYFLDYAYLNADLTIGTAQGSISVRKRCIEDWTVHLVDTGLNSMTGGRLKRLQPWLGDGTFMMTYGDGVSDIDVGELVRFHQSHGKLATVTAVRPPARYGGLKFDGHEVVSFVEKALAGEGWINGGFFVLEPQVLDYIEGDDTHWEGEPMEHLAASGQMNAYQHAGYWHSMDTLRDVRALNDAWANGDARWKTW